jgi:hypothetical protein
MDMSWHEDIRHLEAYAVGEIDEVLASSIEAHLLGCSTCRSDVAAFADHSRIDRLWEDFEERMASPHRGPIERLMTLVGVSDHVARLVAATPSLRASWFGAIAMALAFALLASRTGGAIAFLVLAPLVPVAGVAASFGPGIDPTYEVGLAAPMRGSRLLFVRALAVLVSSVIIAGAAALALPTLDWTALAWLLPSLGLSTASLALSTYWTPLWASGVVAAAWVSGVALVESSSRVDLAAFRGPGQVLFGVVALVSLGVLASRREAFDLLTPAAVPRRTEP